MEKIFHNFGIKAPMTKVYEALTTLQGLKGWWTVDTTGDPKIGGELRFGFSTDMFNRMQVTGSEKDKTVTWKCIDGPEDWIGTTVSFNLFVDQNKNTGVKFVHDGWKEINDFYGACNYHWGLYMKSLKTLCETGKGMPHNY
jgi:uncharacterized protein YndB with AHSA1/START domain